jgi:hypothetical protein
LRIEINDRDGVSGCGGGDREPERDRCLAGAALLADERNYEHVRYLGIELSKFRAYE